MRTLALALVLALGACVSRAAPVAQPAPSQGPSVVRAAVLGTAVVVLPPGAPTAILDGPLLVTTINPGSSMELAIASTGDCTASSLLWFSYSGSGVAVGVNETLCARSAADGPATNAFSGYDPTYRAP